MKKIAVDIKTWQGTVVACAGIGAIVALECVALANGINGVLLAGSIATVAAIVAGFCGFKIGRKK